MQGQPVGHNQRGDSVAQKSQPKPKTDTQPSLPIAVQNNIERIARALEASNRQGNAPNDTSNPNQYAQKNLADQDSMATWAFWMFVVGFMEMLITGAGVWLVYRTLYHTKRAVTHAEEAAKAATEANKLSRQALIADQRAWVKIEAIEIASDLMWLPAGKSASISFALRVKNIGKTVATGIWITLDLHVQTTEDRRAALREFAETAQKMPSIGYSLFPDDFLVQHHVISLRREEIEKFESVIGKDAWKDPVGLPIQLFACVTYGLAFFEERGRTWQALDLRRKGPNLAIGPTFGTIPKSEMVLDRSLLGDTIAQ